MGTVSKAVSVANGWYRLVLSYDGWEANPQVIEVGQRRQKDVGIVLENWKPFLEQWREMEYFMQKAFVGWPPGLMW